MRTTSIRKIPQFEPYFDDEEVVAVTEVLRSGWVNEGEKTREFEREFCRVSGSRHAVTVTSGSVALFLALKALKVGPGDEVIVPDLTFAADANAVLFLGAKPVLVDVNHDGNIDQVVVKGALTPNTKAIIAVNMNGRSVAREVFQESSIPIIEDCAQSLGNRQTGNRSLMTCYSLASTKHLTTAQGGVITTSDEECHDELLRLKDHGRNTRVTTGRVEDYYDHVGLNFKFTEIQAAIGIAQLKKFPEKMRRLSQIYNEYRKHLGSMLLKPDGYWYVDIKAKNPRLLTKELASRGIGSRLQYVPLHQQPLYRSTADFPVADDLYNTTLFLPSSTNLTNEEVAHVSQTVMELSR